MHRKTVILRSSGTTPPEGSKRSARHAVATAPAVLLCVVLFLVAASVPAAAVTVTYRYDQVGRLVEVHYGRTLSILYTWDANGNLLQRTVLGPQARKLIRADEAADQVDTPKHQLAPTSPPVATGEATAASTVGDAVLSSTDPHHATGDEAHPRAP
jgi:hypothetical protein